jgi:hypothetical protein
VDSKRVAAALNTISVAFGELAEALTEQPGSGDSPPVVAAPADEFDIPEEAYSEGHASVCPAHHKPYREGKFGLYCTQPGIDPAWTDRKGYCSITPKNAAKWLSIHA